MLWTEPDYLRACYECGLVADHGQAQLPSGIEHEARKKIIQIKLLLINGVRVVETKGTRLGVGHSCWEQRELARIRTLEFNNCDTPSAGDIDVVVSDYDCEIRYHPGKANVVADALSRKERIKPKRVRANRILYPLQCFGHEMIEQRSDRIFGLRELKWVTFEGYWWPGWKSGISLSWFSNVFILFEGKDWASKGPYGCAQQT
ncbi:hypothetical protein Tco_1378208 [Tanacetum coccineum]